MLKNVVRRSVLISVLVVMVIGLAACGGVKAPKTYQYDDLTKYITLGKYENLKYTDVKVHVSDAEVMAYIDDVRKKAATTKEITSGTVQATDKVKIDYTGKRNGKKFDGGSAKDYTMDLANSGFIDGFSDGIIGHSVGDTFDEELTFPKNYSTKELAGKKATFTITIKAIVKDVVPEYDDAFVKKNTKYDSTAAYEKSVYKQLRKQKEQSAKSTEQKEIFSQILASSKVVKYPSKELKAAEEQMKGTYENLAQKYGMEYDKFVQQNMGMSEKDFGKKIQEYAKNTVKQQLVLHQLAKKLEVEVSDEDYDQYVQDLLKANDIDEDSFKDKTGETVEEYAEENNLYDSLLYDKVMEKVMKVSVAR